MAIKKDVSKGKKTSETKKTLKNKFSLRMRTDMAWKNFTFFLVIFILSFILYSFSVNELLRNFFGILSVVLGFLAFAFLIAFVALSILRSGKK